MQAVYAYQGPGLQKEIADLQRGVLDAQQIADAATEQLKKLNLVRLPALTAIKVDNKARCTILCIGLQRTNPCCSAHAMDRPDMLVWQGCIYCRMWRMMPELEIKQLMSAMQPANKSHVPMAAELRMLCLKKGTPSRCVLTWSMP